MNITFPYKSTGDEFSAAEVNEIKSAVNSKGEILTFNPDEFTGVGTPEDPIKMNQSTIIHDMIVFRDTVTNENYTMFFQNGEMKIIQSSYLPVPATPTNSIVDDIADTFDFTYSPNYEDINQYEYTVTAGSIWYPAPEKPILVGNIRAEINTVGVRVRGIVGVNKPSEILWNNSPYIPVLQTPSIPTAPVTDDVNNTYNWTNSPGYPLPQYYEYTIDGGNSYQPVDLKPIGIGNIDKPVGTVGVRVKAGEFNYVSPTLYNLEPFTITYLYPGAPTNGIVNDNADTFNWTNVSGFSRVIDYEFTLDSGNSYDPVTVKPVYVGNENYQVGQVGVRVREQLNNAVGATLYNAVPFFKVDLGTTYELDFTGTFMSELEPGIWIKTGGGTYDEILEPNNSQKVVGAGKPFRMWAQVGPTMEITIQTAPNLPNLPGNAPVGIQASLYQGDYRIIAKFGNADTMAVQNLPVGRFYGIYRNSLGQFYCQTSADGINWTNAYDYQITDTSTQIVYIKATRPNPLSRVDHPKLTVFNGAGAGFFSLWSDSENWDDTETWSE